MYGIIQPDDKEKERPCGGIAVPEIIPVSVLPSLEIDVKDVFKGIPLF
jgi:hypothetical protein